MTFRFNICPQRGKNDDGDEQVWVEVYAEPTPKLRHCIPSSDELLAYAMPRLEALVEQVYEAGKRDGQAEVKKILRDLVRDDTPRHSLPHFPLELYTPQCDPPELTRWGER